MTGSVWIISYVLLWGAVVLLGFSVVVLLRQIGVLHTRVAPMGVHFAGEGPELDAAAPELDDVTYGDDDITLVAFTSPTCEICASLKPGLRRLAHSYDEVGLHVVDHETAAEVFARFEVRSTPYLVAVDGEGIVRSRGVANTLDQAEEMLAEVLAGPPIDLDLKLGTAGSGATVDVIADVGTDDGSLFGPAAKARTAPTAPRATATSDTADNADASEVVHAAAPIALATAEAEATDECCGRGDATSDADDADDASDAAAERDTADDGDTAERDADDDGIFGTAATVVVLP
ncbi:MAG: thioredoxin domain-containing protein [Actinomycetota bacterium]